MRGKEVFNQSFQVKKKKQSRGLLFLLLGKKYRDPEVAEIRYRLKLRKLQQMKLWHTIQDIRLKSEF